MKYNYSPMEPKVENFISPNLNSNQGSVLKNLNDFKISESFNIDNERLLNYKINRRPVYNIISHEQNEFDPIDVKMNKWSKYHEK